MRARALVLLLSLAACAPPSSRRVDLDIVNRCDHAIVILARTGGISRRICLGPDGSFDGWMVNPGGGRVSIELLPGP